MLIVLIFFIFLNVVISQGCGKASPFTRSAYQYGSMISSSLNRTFNIYLPASYNVNVAMPVLLLFHGGGGNGAQAEFAYGINPKAEASNFIGVFPDGISKTWNAGTCCAPATTLGIKDVLFVSELIDYLSTILCIDLTRVYATGMSNGAILSHRLGCELSNKIAAIAPVAGTLGDRSTNFHYTCAPPRPVPVMHTHGVGDLNVPFYGGMGCGPSGTSNFTSVPYTLDTWMTINQCNQSFVTGPSTFVVQEDANISTYLSDGCATTPVKLVLVVDGGHSWSGGLKLANSSGCGNSTYWIGTISTTDLVWEFLSQFSLPTASSAPTVNGATNSPTVNGATNSPTTSGATNSPTASGATNSPTTSGGSNAPTTSGGSNAPTASGATNSPTLSGGSNAPTTSGGSNAPTTSGGSNAPTTSGGSNAPTTSGGSNAPTINGATNSPTPPTNQTVVAPTGLSGGAIAGIAIGAVVGAILVAVIVGLVVKTACISNAEHV